ncbi:MAG: hypothetical protein U1E58_07600 [Tabrizicola sp.]
MTNPNAEAQRRWRQRQKTKKKEALTRASSTSNVFQAPFHESLPEDYEFSSDFADAFELIGLPTPEFKDDRGPESFSLDAGAEDAGVFTQTRRSLGRAEIMIGALISAAVDLAAHVNAFKRSEIQQRLDELARSELTDTEAKANALAEAARLNRMLEQLDKQVRWTFPQWKVAS